VSSSVVVSDTSDAFFVCSSRRRKSTMSFSHVYTTGKPLQRIKEEHMATTPVQKLVRIHADDLLFLQQFLRHQTAHCIQRVDDPNKYDMLERVDKAIENAFEFRMHNEYAKTLEHFAKSWLERNIPGAIQLAPRELEQSLTNELKMAWKYAIEHVKNTIENAAKKHDYLAEEYPTQCSSAAHFHDKLKAQTLRRFMEVFL
jgi:hypothetical protein